LLRVEFLKTSALYKQCSCLQKIRHSGLEYVLITYAIFYDCDIMELCSLREAISEINFTISGIHSGFNSSMNVT